MCFLHVKDTSLCRCTCARGILCGHTYRRANLEECLPHDVLNEIMGYLDRETICSARLVSKTFCTAASARFGSVTLASTSEAVSFHRYPQLEHITVEHDYLKLDTQQKRKRKKKKKTMTSVQPGEAAEKSLARLEPCLRDLATALTITHEYNKPSIARVRDYLSQAALMPKLRKLEVKGNVKHEAALLACCTNLEAINFQACGISVARTIVTMTRLTSLQIDSVLKDSGRAQYADISWLGHATNLRCLQTLSTPTPDAALPLIGNLTGLTGLTLCAWGWETTSNIAPLTRLISLKSLCISWGVTESDLEIACSLGLGSLVNLELWVCEGASADCGRLLTRQTALTQLSLRGWQLCNLRHIGGLRVELLQCLTIFYLRTLDAEGLSVLSRATSLTSLSIGPDARQVQAGLSQVLGGLTQLRSLRLTAAWIDATNFLDFPLAFSPLTALTQLKFFCHKPNDGIVGALLSLTGLRVLELSQCCMTPDELPELGRLTNLSRLRAFDCGVTSLAPVSEVLDPLRKARGLAPLYTSV